jgi:hypothetical protein
MEDVYADLGGSTGKNNAKPVLVVNLAVPGVQVDVNVHPSKRQVALMYQEDIVMAVTAELRRRLEHHGQTFATQSVAVRNPYAKKNQQTSQKRKLPEPQEPSALEEKDGNATSDDDGAGPLTSPSSRKENGKNSNSLQEQDNGSISSNKKGKVAPSKLIRTNKAAPHGAIEPFLVSTQPTTPSQSQSESPLQGEAPSQRRHIPICPLSGGSPSSPSSVNSSLDLSQPGAFADAMKCNCPPDAARRTVLVKQPAVRPKRVIPTQCSYTSISSLRKRVHKQQCMETTQQLRQAFFMGVFSHQVSRFFGLQILCLESVHVMPCVEVLLI